jgi:hypothetical protein
MNAHPPNGLRSGPREQARLNLRFTIYDLRFEARGSDSENDFGEKPHPHLPSQGRYGATSPHLLTQGKRVCFHAT